MPKSRIVFTAPPEIDWQADTTSSLTGNWSQTAHWSTGSVPGIADAVVIEITAATTAWTVAEAGRSAASLLLDMALGTFEVKTALTVQGTLTQMLGTLLLVGDTTAGVAELVQTGGSIVLQDNGDSATQLVSTGTDALNGSVSLRNGARWSDAALGIGAGGDVSLTGGTATSHLSVAGALQLGADPSADNMGGAGTLSVAHGSTAEAGTLLLLAGSLVTLDATSFLDVGSEAIAVAGTLVVGAAGSLTADIATIDAALQNDGSVAIGAYDDNGVLSGGTVLVSGGVVDNGTLSVGGGSTLTVAGSTFFYSPDLGAGQVAIQLAGSLAVTAGSTLIVGAPGTAGVLSIGGASLILNAATLNSIGSYDTLNSDTTLTNGAVWNTNGLYLIYNQASNVGADSARILLDDSTVADAGILDMGRVEDPDHSSYTSGTIVLQGSSRLTAASLQMLDNSSELTLAPAASVVIGSAPSVAGAVVIGAGATLSGEGSITGNVVDNGTLLAPDVYNNGDDIYFSGLSITGSLSGAGHFEVDGESTLEIGNAAGFTGSIFQYTETDFDFGNILILDTGDMPDTTTPVNYDTEGATTIDVRGLAYDGGALTKRIGAKASQLVVTNATTTATLGIIAPNFSLYNFSFADDLSGGTLVIDTPCYAAGTRIATGSGETPVEALRPGDLVRTADGRLVPVRWVGVRRVDLTRHPKPWRAAPIRIAADAIANGVPARDLFVSPDHGLYLNGYLVPAWRMANGATIARQDDWRSVTYLHVELDRHEIIVAENCPAESFLDTGNRALFANAPGLRPLHPDLSNAPGPAALAVWAALGAAPLLLDGPVLATLRNALIARAENLGWARTALADPALAADGLPIPLRPLGDAWRARLPPSVRRLRLASSSFVPAELDPGSGDTRRLGLAVRAVRLDGAALTQFAFVSGWHAAESGFRWTDGAAEILIAPRARPVTFEILADPLGQFWQPPDVHTSLPRMTKS